MAMSFRIFISILCIVISTFCVNGDSNDILLKSLSNDDFKVSGLKPWLRSKAGDFLGGGELDVQSGLAVTQIGNISTECYNDVMTYASDVAVGKTYALKMDASWGTETEMLTAFFTGNAKSYGSYQLCTRIEPGSEEATFKTQYCGISYRVTPVNILATVGSCWPSSCSAEDLQTVHKQYVGNPTDPSYGAFYDCLVDFPWTAGAIVTVSLLSLIAFIVLIGSAYHVLFHNRVTTKIDSNKHKNTITHFYEQTVEVESEGSKVQESSLSNIDDKNELIHNGNLAGEENGVVSNGKLENHPDQQSSKAADAPEITKIDIEETKRGKKKIKKYDILNRTLMSFSVFKNTEDIFTVGKMSSTSALNGMRVLSMWWIILLHSLEFLAVGNRYENNAFVYTVVFDSPLTWVYFNGNYAVDTFFVLSGFLVTYNTLKKLQRNNGGVNWFKHLFHRYWRITPTYMAVMAIVATLPNYLGKGVVKNGFMGTIVENCQKYWWTHPLYINNLYPYPGNTYESSCVGWAWYLANDMQFHFLSPIIVYLLWKYRKFGASLIAGLCLVSFGGTAYIVTYWGFGLAGTGPYNDRMENNPDFPGDVIYTKPWTRISPYLVGMVLGYIIYKLNGKEVKMKKWMVFVGWVLGFAVGLLVLYGQEFTKYGPQTPQWVSVFYHTVGRFAFGIAVSWVAFVCITGNGGYVNSFLSWGVWSPLGKLSFCAYMIHPIVIMLVVMTKKTTFLYTPVEIGYWVLANIFVSYLCAYVIAVAVEFPSACLEKEFITPHMKDKKKNK